MSLFDTLGLTKASKHLEALAKEDVETAMRAAVQRFSKEDYGRWMSHSRFGPGWQSFALDVALQLRETNHRKLAAVVASAGLKMSTYRHQVGWREFWSVVKVCARRSRKKTLGKARKLVKQNDL